MTYPEVIKRLEQLADQEKVIFKEKKFGVVAHNALGVYHKDLKELAKEIGINSKLALELFDGGIYEGRLLCSKIFKPKDLNKPLIAKWIKSFENWEICDSFCMGLFAKSEFALSVIRECHQKEAEFEKRAAFATMAAYCMADKKASNEIFESFFPILKQAATDERLYVKKAVNWALRNLGKRNKDLHQKAIQLAEDILKIENKAAQWIAKDALKEFHKENLRMSDYPRMIYRPK